MKKIIYLLCLLVFAVSLNAIDYYDTAFNTWSDKLFVINDGLSASMSVVSISDDGVATPLSISTEGLQFTTTKRLWFRDTASYIYSSGTDDLNIVSAQDMTLDCTKLYLRSTDNYIDSNDDLTLNGDITCVDVTASGTNTVPTVTCTTFTATGTSTITDADVTTLDVSGTSTLAITNISGAAGITDANVTTLDVTGTSTLAVTNISGATALTAAGTALAVTNNQTIGGTLAVTGTTALTGIVSCGAALKTDTINEAGSSTGVTIDDLLLKDGNVYLDDTDNFISFDDDDDTYFYGKSSDGNIGVKINNADNFNFSANVFSALDGSKFTTDTIDETNSAVGVTIDGCTFEGKAAFYSVIAPSGTYIGIVDSDSETDPSSWSLTDNKDLYIEGKLEVDGATYLDGTLKATGTTTLATLEFSGDDPEISPSTQESEDGKNFIIHGGDGSTNGGDLYLDGGAATNDGDVILGDRDGMISINAPILLAESKELTCNGGGVAANLTEYVNYIVATANDTITVADGTANQVLRIATKTNASTFDIHVIPTTCGWGSETILDSATSACELHFYDGKWYILSITD